MSDMARRVTARFIRGLIKKAKAPARIAVELEHLAQDVEAGESIGQWKPRRRQKGKAKRLRQKRYRQTRQKSRRQSQKWRKRNPSKIKRYERKRRQQPQRHRLRMAEAEGVPFWDLEHGTEGEITNINPEEETLQAVIDGEPHEYGIFPFLDDTVFTSPEGEDEFFETLDEEWDDRDLAELEGGGEMDRQAKEMRIVWLVHDTPPPTSYKDPTWRDSFKKLTVDQFVNYVARMHGRWENWNFALHDDESSAVKDAESRVERWIHRFDIARG